MVPLDRHPSVAPLHQDRGVSQPQEREAGCFTSFPGLVDLTGARVFAELGGDRFASPTPRDLKAYAGSAPITHVSG